MAGPATRISTGFDYASNGFLAFMKTRSSGSWLLAFCIYVALAGERSDMALRERWGNGCPVTCAIFPVVYDK